MRVLLLGAYGQVGSQLVRALSLRGVKDIFTADLHLPVTPFPSTTHITLDALDKSQLNNTLLKNKITDVYCLVALLSATGEKDPLFTQNINMKALFNCLEAAREQRYQKLFWPSSIAAFGTNSPKDTPQYTIMEPSTVYGMTKKYGELWCNYYNRRYGVDVRSIRYPGLVGYRSVPGGGTTDYAVSIYHSAILGEEFQCYLAENTPLPMIYTDDAVDATLQLMDAPSHQVKVRTSYNLQGMTFTPKQIYQEIRKVKPEFRIKYKVDPIRQAIAESWPHSLADAEARKDWNYLPKYNLQQMTKEILHNLTPELVRKMRK